MPDSLLLPFTLDRAVDANGATYAAAVRVCDAGTSDEKNVYTNSTLVTAADNPILSDDGGWFAARYIGTGSYKLIFYNTNGSALEADWTTIKTEDNLPGALNTSTFTPTFAKPDTPVINKASDFTITTDDLGKIINVDPTGGAVVGTLVSAVTAGDGARLTLRHIGTANAVTIVGVSSQTIDGATSRALTLRYESVCLVSDGANWHIDGYAPPVAARGSLPFFRIVDRLTAPPSSPTAGARYILNGTGTGTWSAYSQHDVLESDGQGGWIRYTPAEGWFVYVEDENLYTAFVGTAWADQSGMAAAQSSTLGILVAMDVKANATEGGDVTTGSWQTRTLNTSVQNSITGASLASDTITLPAGNYLILGHAAVGNSLSTRLRFKSTTTATVVNGVNAHGLDANVRDATVSGYLTIAAAEAFKLEYYANSSGDTTNQGRALAGESGSEYYACLTILSLSSLQGAAGAQGTQGPQGFAGLKYTFSPTTAMADPGAGIVRLNHATPASVTAIAIDDTSAETGNPNVSAEILTWDDGSSTQKGKVKVSKTSAPENFAVYQLTALTDNVGWNELAVTYVTGSGTFSNTDSVSVEFIEKGDKGDTGSTGPTGSTTFNFDSATADADPGTGDLRLNNATPASATAAYVDNNNRGGSDISGWLDTFDDIGTSGNRGTLHLFHPATTTTNFRIYTVSGSVVDGTGYRKLTIAHVAGAGSFTDGTEIVAAFYPRGDTGIIGGSTGASDNRVLRADGTGGATVQNTGITVDDSNNMSGVVALSATTIELGHASDTTLARSAAGIVTVEGTPLRKAGKETIWIPAAAMWARTTNGPGAASRELTTSGDVMIKGWAFDTTTEEAVQFYIGFPKSWDKGTVTFQAYWTNASGASTETVSWGLSAGAFTDDDAIDSTELGTEVRVSDTWLAQNDMHVSAESAAVTVGNTPIDGDMIIGQIARSVANDNMTGDADLLGIKIFFTTSAATDA